MFSAFLLGYAAFQIPAGWLVGKLGPRRTLTFGLIWWSALSVATALVPPTMAGALWVYFIGEAFPQFVFDPLFDLAVVLMAFFGGLGTIAGPVLGALILEPLQLYLNLQQSNGYESEILFGGLFLVVILFLPRGVLPTAAEYLRAGNARLSRRRAGRQAAPAAQSSADSSVPGGVS